MMIMLLYFNNLTLIGKGNTNTSGHAKTNHGKLKRDWWTPTHI